MVNVKKCWKIAIIPVCKPSRLRSYASWGKFCLCNRFWSNQHRISIIKNTVPLRQLHYWLQKAKSHDQNRVQWGDNFPCTDWNLASDHGFYIIDSEFLILECTAPQYSWNKMTERHPTSPCHISLRSEETIKCFVELEIWCWDEQLLSIWY